MNRPPTALRPATAAKRMLIAAAMLMPLAAAAVEFNAVLPEKSSIGFVSKQMGVPVEGKFGRFVSKIVFDPAKPAKATAQIEIDLASIDTGSTEANEEVKDKAWFNIREFPAAKFASSSVRALGGGRFEASGKMTIKGRTRDVVAPFSFREEGAVAMLEGSIPILRLQYGIGEGLWADTSTVADEVQVRFRFTVGVAKK